MINSKKKLWQFKAEENRIFTEFLQKPTGASLLVTQLYSVLANDPIIEQMTFCPTLWLGQKYVFSCFPSSLFKILSSYECSCPFFYISGGVWLFFPKLSSHLSFSIFCSFPQRLCSLPFPPSSWHTQLLLLPWSFPVTSR